MPIPLETIHQNIKEKRITRINQLFEYATIKEWKELIYMGKCSLRRLLEDPERFKERHVFYISDDTGIPESVLWRLIQEQKRHNQGLKGENK
jgi:hypothetical protein